MKKRRVSRKRQKQPTIPSWVFVIATIVVIGLLGWYISKNDTSGADAATLACGTIQTAKITPAGTQTISVGDTVNFSVCVTNATYNWTIDRSRSSAKASLTNVNSSQVALTATSITPNVGGKVYLQVKITPKGQVNGASRMLATTVIVLPTQQITSVQISYTQQGKKTSTADYPVIESSKTLNLSASVLGTFTTLNTNNVHYTWKIQNTTATCHFSYYSYYQDKTRTHSSGTGVNKENISVATNNNTNPRGGYCTISLDATYLGITKSAKVLHIMVAPQQPVLDSVSGLPPIGTYFSGKTYTFTAKATDASGKPITDNLTTFKWTWSGLDRIRSKSLNVSNTVPGVSKATVILTTSTGGSAVLYVTATRNGIVQQGHAVIILLPK